MACRIPSAWMAAALMAMAATASAEGLQSYFAKALQNDPDFAAARAAHDAEVQSRFIGRAGLLPSVSLTASKNKNHLRREELTTPERDVHYRPDSIALRINQPLFDMERWAAYREGDARAGRAEILLADSRQELALRLAQTYFNYLLAQENLALARAQKRALAAQRNQAENLFKGGAATRTDVEETKAREQLSEAQELSAANAVELRRKELGKIIGEAPSTGATATAAMSVLASPEPSDLSAWVDAARTRNLKVQSQQGALAIAGYQNERARAGYYPKVSVVASRQKAHEPNYFTRQEHDSQIGIQLSMSLFDGGSTTGAVRQGEALRERVRHELASAIQDAEIKASQSFLEIVNGIAQVKALELAVTSAETTLRGMEAGQRAGLRTNTDVLNAQQQVFSAKRELQKARYDYLMSRLALQAATGRLDETELKAVDTLLGFEANIGNVPAK